MSFVSFAFLLIIFAPNAQAYEVAKRYRQPVKISTHYRVAFADENLRQKYDVVLKEIVRDFHALPCGPKLEITKAASANIIIQKGPLPETFAAHTKRKLSGRRVVGAVVTLNAEFLFADRFPQPTPALSMGTTLRHELGHALGLEHSRKKGALMHAAAVKSDHTSRFAFDDLMAFCHLYQE